MDTRMHVRGGVVLALCLLLLGACVAAPAGAVPVPTPTPSGNREVTLADEGRTLEMRVGESLVLRLGEGYIWTAEVSDPAVISLIPGMLPVQGVQGIFQAHQAGTATLTASGDPLCRQSQPPCGMPSRLFTLYVVVRP